VIPWSHGCEDRATLESDPSAQSSRMAQAHLGAGATRLFSVRQALLSKKPSDAGRKRPATHSPLPGPLTP
jgi:hypothetical protein